MATSTWHLGVIIIVTIIMPITTIITMPHLRICWTAARSSESEISPAAWRILTRRVWALLRHCRDQVLIDNMDACPEIHH